ncbi:DUF1292 domain-containing protein [Clostridium celatum]|uniref:DUF1292 domain-containing protein n=1 Tax=Clostridium celatum DSM 1785 TaxID=545697 RepID=L1Q7S9_9CLOT|nr:DUF1292 domain-containing protein [Clostridium celatum]EKY24013.1 hypothetical protein HMPREF0216_02772 [Clostridium celatum DSM 1785]MCE9655687.1 DUF1292 domain-containing protein [Clostridium celatum]MDU3723050.1 DUF1292 domain-containing protein [Clostridium celatum]MDU6295613.1 DUF1292 domain-containing protein [Clostridium celatum]MDY3360456.1 DUF1292 domain-containing protein [Clostridium celatum]
MPEKTMKFTDDEGNKVEYAILEQKLINNTEYVAMAPVNNKNDVEIFKIKFDKDWNETLIQVESEVELNMVRQVSNVKF